MNKVLGKFVGEIECKRFSVPGISIKVICPNCQCENIISLEDNYIEYPTPKDNLLSTCCEECDDTINVCLDLDIKLKITKVESEG